jgi:hypothetical protein
MEDEYETSRLDRKVSMVGWLHRNNRCTARPTCYCCGRCQGIRRAIRKYNRHSEGMRERNVYPWNAETRGKKPKRKDHR